LDQEQQREEALTYYIRSYNAGDPDPVRRGVIEELYRKMHGSVAGLDERIAGVASNVAPASAIQVPVAAAASPEATPAEAAIEKATPSPTEPLPATTPVAEPPAEPIRTPTPEATPEATPAASPVVETPVVQATPEPKASPEATPEPSPALPEASPSASPAPSRPRETDSSPVGEMLPTLPTTVKLTGKVKNGAGEPVANVVVVLISPRGSVLSSTTDVEGNFSFVVPPSSQGYRVIPSKEGFTFTPLDKLLPAMTEDLKGVDFVAEAAKPG
ncbi:MAG TPA: carboxypeptidase regulatory-like domain-containing protein, partial [Pyrinomonadaceae bacterium]|nr:carboxypeptidase regulatory-like domain-containing protein [Pyrinomonadaceae bacterium]